MQFRKKRANSETSMSQNEPFKIKLKLIVKKSKFSTKRNKFDFFLLSLTFFVFSSTSIRSTFKFSFVSKSTFAFVQKFKIAFRSIQIANVNYYAFLKISLIAENNDSWKHIETWQTIKKTWLIRKRKQQNKIIDQEIDLVINSMIDLMIDSMTDENENEDEDENTSNFDEIFSIFSSTFSKFMKISKLLKRFKIKKAFALLFSSTSKVIFYLLNVKVMYDEIITVFESFQLRNWSIHLKRGNFFWYHTFMKCDARLWNMQTFK